jgi:hypothetical protein
VDKLVLEEFEHIEFIECSYSNQGLHSLIFKTNTGKTISCEGSAGVGTQQRKLNLREHNKAVIGFRGVYSSSHMLDLFMYVSLRLDIITETQHNAAMIESHRVADTSSQQLQYDMSER